MEFLTKILAGLKTKYAHLGFSTQTLTAVATYLAANVKEESQVDTAVAGAEALLKPFQSEADTQRTANAKLVEDLKKAKAEAESKLKELEEKGGGNPNPANTGGNNEEVPAWAKTLIDANTDLKKELATFKTEKVTGSRKEQLNELIKTLPENFQKPYSRIDLSSKTDDEFIAFMDEVKGEVEETMKEVKSLGYQFTPPGSGSSDPDPTQASKDEVKAALKAAGV